MTSPVTVNLARLLAGSFFGVRRWLPLWIGMAQSKAATNAALQRSSRPNLVIAARFGRQRLSLGSEEFGKGEKPGYAAWLARRPGFGIISPSLDTFWHFGYRRPPPARTGSLNGQGRTHESEGPLDFAAAPCDRRCACGLAPLRRDRLGSEPDGQDLRRGRDPRRQSCRAPPEDHGGRQDPA